MTCWIIAVELTVESTLGFEAGYRGDVSRSVYLSLDGYVTGPNDGPGRGLGDGGERLHYWVFGGPWSYDREPEGEATGAVSKEEDLGAATVLSHRVDGRRDVVEPERLEVGPEPVALAGPVAPQFEDPAVVALLGQVRSEAGAEAAVGEGPVCQDDRCDVRHLRRVPRQSDRDAIFGDDRMHSGRHLPMNPIRFRDGTLRRHGPASWSASVSDPPPTTRLRRISSRRSALNFDAMLMIVIMNVCDSCSAFHLNRLA